MIKKRTCTIEDLRSYHYERACEILNRECGEGFWQYPKDVGAGVLEAVALHVAETEDFPDKTAERFEDVFGELSNREWTDKKTDLLAALRKADLIKEVE